MEEWRNLGKKLEQFIRPATFPIAVRFLAAGEDAPENSRRPLEETGHPIAICQGLTLTRTRGLTMLFDREGSGCPLATTSYGWDDHIDPSFMLSFFQMMNYARDEAAAGEKLNGMDKLETGKWPGVVFSPLTRTRVIPHLIMVYGNPAQVMRLVHAASRWSGYKVDADFGGIAGSCNEGVLRTFIEDKPRVALPGNGDRVFAAARDDELIFAFPASWADRLVEGLESTSARGVRYPIPTFMLYELPFSELMERFNK